MMLTLRTISLGVVALFLMTSATLLSQVIPHHQDKPPGPALSPQEAIKAMTVPEGFKVELVASEPMIVNPVAMTFDERGRVWITESLEYPRSSPGVGKDRVKTLEDTDGDGAMDKMTVFAEGLNIPSGIAVGHGGVWVANAPDLLFLQDTDGDGKADKQEVVVTGFGRTDTHELPNSLTWGPDGWLYGLNGVFNFSHVFYSKENKNYKADHAGWKFTCAMFRIHPRTREFQIFCEGTSNPWGIAFDNEGSAFISACVIDHLWHLVETGYYHRQGGPYPPYTWKIESIVKHKHQKAAYCGLTFFDSDAYPEQYREKLYMGNIHGNCINSDKLQRDGSTYFATPEPDFLTANDAWFMPVAQKTGPDGCLYILDWYDQYHCYQDARRDPNGIERAKGRLYRVRYKDSPRAPKFDLAKETDEQLIERLKSPNVYFRDAAQRLLSERNNKATNAGLQKLTLNETETRKSRMHALWALMGTGSLSVETLTKFMTDRDPLLRAWGFRAAGNQGTNFDGLNALLFNCMHDESADVRLQVAITASKVPGLKPISFLMGVLESNHGDKLIPHVVWQNIHPLLENQSDEFVAFVNEQPYSHSLAIRSLLPRAIERMLGRKNLDLTPVVALIAQLTSSSDEDGVTRQCLAILASRIQTGEIKGEQSAALRDKLQPVLSTILSSKGDRPFSFDAAVLSATWNNPAGLDIVGKTLRSTSESETRRLQAVNAMIASGDKSLLDGVAGILGDRKASSPEFRGQVLAAVGRLDDPRVADVVLTSYSKQEPDVQPKAIELLTQRTVWSKRLLTAIGKKEVPVESLNVNQVRKLLASKDAELVKLVTAQWGTVREQRNPQREAIIAEMKTLIRKTPGDANRGQEVYKKLCGQCHKIYGEGQEVGPDITVNGRSSFDQLLSNVFDPSLVIGAAYQARTVVTTQGRVLTGLVAEDNDQRIVLKVQGGKQEVIPRNEIEETKLSELSLMPEDLEKQLKPQEIADLFAYITLDRPPSDPKAKQLPGVREDTPAKK